MSLLSSFLLCCLVGMLLLSCEVSSSVGEENDGDSSSFLDNNITHYLILLKPPKDPPEDFSPVSYLHHEAAAVSAGVPFSSIGLVYENFAKYLRMYMFSIHLQDAQDVAKLGKLSSRFKSLEAVSEFRAAELVTDISNLAHGLPYRQVLNRPLRDMQEVIIDGFEVENKMCSLEFSAWKNLTTPIELETSMGRDDNILTKKNVSNRKKFPQERNRPDFAVTVYVLDTGIQSSHSWFRLGQVIRGYDFEGLEEANSTVKATDQHGHGTQIAGIIGGVRPLKGSDGTETSAPSNVKLVSVRVLDSNGRGEADIIIAGLDYCIGHYFEMKKLNPRTANKAQKHLPAVVHMSFSGRASRMLKKAVNAVAKGGETLHRLVFV